MAKGTGEQCRNFVPPGSLVCRMHGLTGNGFRKAEERVTLAQLLEQDRRHPWEVVLDATHTMDAIVRDLQLGVLAGETITVDQLDRLINVNQIRHHLASTAISTKAHENVAMAFTRHLEMEGQLVGLAIGAVVHGMTRSLDPRSGDQLRDWALTQAHRVLADAQPGQTLDEAPDVEPPPFALAVVTGEHDIPARHRVIEGGSPYDVGRLNDDALAELAGRVLDERNRRINAS